MAIPLFKSFLSTVARAFPRPISSVDRLLVHPVTGAPMGIQNSSDNGPNGMWSMVDITPAQATSPTQAMIDDLDATYRVNTAPYARYQSNGTTLVSLAETADNFTGLPAILQTVPPGTPLLTIGPNSYLDVWSPFTVQNLAGVSVQGKLTVLTRPA